MDSLVSKTKSDAVSYFSIPLSNHFSVSFNLKQNNVCFSCLWRGTWTTTSTPRDPRAAVVRNRWRTAPSNCSDVMENGYDFVANLGQVKTPHPSPFFNHHLYFQIFPPSTYVRFHRSGDYGRASTPAVDHDWEEDVGTVQ